MKNDDKILTLKKQIETKKAELKKSKKFTPVTNCNLILNDKRYNIHTLNEENSIMELLVNLNVLKNSAKELNFLDKYKISGYLVSEWIEDLQSKMDNINVKAEEGRLKLMEAKLTKLLSEEKKTELELEEIEKMLS